MQQQHLKRLATLVLSKRIIHSNPNTTSSSPIAPQESIQWKPIPSKLSFSRRIALYQALSKSRLSSLITLTTMASYALSPITAATPPSSLTTLLATATGTFLCSASANTLNQIFEAPMDAQMSRTRTRPLARRAISTHHASVFATLSGLSGTAILATMVNPTTAVLGLSNLILYAFVYTPLKRISVINTWLGALVGGLPALMGSTAAGASLGHPASWLTAGLLYVWQFPHFNSLAHTLRRDYARAGYQMMANLHPAMNARVSLRYAIAAVPLSSWLVPYYGLTTTTFGLLSLIPNLALVLPAFRFWIATPHGPLSRKLLNSIAASNFLPLRSIALLTHSFQSKTRQEQEAKKLFWASLIHLPTLLILMMACRPSQSDYPPSSQDNPPTPSQLEPPRSM
ncbi:protoheme IX farnesyltransferase [Puccinia sorghi]|uniref:Protoheme IX farnesyltransferase, mitochondrial n=1 Tax=Puccinia sorghi TaxID=27349 RepID=A0A0L6U899_9BASI|nr:protoheme IX farnesyltransferase [Puccinia sorghi]